MSGCAARYLLALISCVIFALVSGCHHTVMGNPPACPEPTELLIEDLTTMIVRGDYPQVQIWISRVERYCSGIDEMRSG